MVSTHKMLNQTLQRGVTTKGRRYEASSEDRTPDAVIIDRTRQDQLCLYREF